MLLLHYTRAEGG